MNIKSRTTLFDTTGDWKSYLPLCLSKEQKIILQIHSVALPKLFGSFSSIISVVGSDRDVVKKCWMMFFKCHRVHDTMRGKKENSCKNFECHRIGCVCCWTTKPLATWNCSSYH